MLGIYLKVHMIYKQTNFRIRKKYDVYQDLQIPLYERYPKVNSHGGCHNNCTSIFLSSFILSYMPSYICQASIVGETWYAKKNHTKNPRRK